LFFVIEALIFIIFKKKKKKKKFKEFQKWVPLADGIGFGKVLLSVKYKSVKMVLPRSLQGSGKAENKLIIEYCNKRIVLT
jgi:hypothetical protein